MSSVPPAGSLVAVWNDGELQCAVVGGEEKRRLRLVDKGGREFRVQPSRVVVEIERGGEAPGKTPEQLRSAGERAAAMDRQVRRLAGACDVELLWELASEQPRVWSVESLSDLAFGRVRGPEPAALIRALQDDRIRFVRRGDGWEPRPAEAVEQLVTERRRARERAAARERLLGTLRTVAAGGVFEASGDDEERRYLVALRETAIRDLDAADASKKLAQDALDAAGLRFDRLAEGAFRLLRLLGEFDSDDENLQVRRYGLQREFPVLVEEHARRSAAAGFAREGRRDLSALEVVTIDASHTREIDDGLSVEPLADGRLRLGIHIADPAAFIQPEDPVDHEALARGVTHYLPDGKLLMIPAPISEEAASLVEGAERPALSFLVEIDENGRSAGYEVFRSVVRTAARLSYERVDRALRHGDDRWSPLLRALDEATIRRERRRFEAGAVRIPAPEVEVFVDDDGRVRLERLEADSPARRCVSEAMILAGRVAARYCCDRGVPAIFRRQPAPERRPELPIDGCWDPAAVYAARRSLRRGEVGLEPAPHHALGLEAYAQATSPLRRYQDLAIHRQIASTLDGGPPLYDEESLRRIAATTEQAEIDSRRIERASQRYWLLRYIEQQGVRSLAGVVVATEPRPVVQLEETLIEQPVPSAAGLALGSGIELELQRVNPRADLLVLRALG